jgi:hypothetical protein
MRHPLCVAFSLVMGYVAARIAHGNPVNPEFSTTIAVVIPVFALALSAELVVGNPHANATELHDSAGLRRTLDGAYLPGNRCAHCGCGQQQSSFLVGALRPTLLLKRVFVVGFGADQAFPESRFCPSDDVDKPLTVAAADLVETRD